MILGSSNERTRTQHHPPDRQRRLGRPAPPNPNSAADSGLACVSPLLLRPSRLVLGSKVLSVNGFWFATCEYLGSELRLANIWILGCDLLIAIWVVSCEEEGEGKYAW